MYSAGRRLLSENPAEARNYYERAAELGNRSAIYALGVIARQEGRLEEARGYLERAAALGEPRALFVLGSVSADLGDRRLARHYFKQAKAQGYAPSPDEIRAWYETSASKGGRSAKSVTRLLDVAASLDRFLPPWNHGSKSGK